MAFDVATNDEVVGDDPGGDSVSLDPFFGQRHTTGFSARATAREEADAASHTVLVA